MHPRIVTLAGRRFADLPLAALSVLLAGGDPPSEVRLFAAGVNDTEKGPFIFDEIAAQSVMAAASAWNVDTMIDLEHLSLDEDSPAFDPDARGWGRLEVRPGPELWIVGLTWNEDGKRRLTQRTQRYLSPAFTTDAEGRVTQIINIALTAIPATHSAPALVAANARKSMLTAEQKALVAKIAKLRREGVADDVIVQTLAIDIKTLQSVVKAMGGDPGADLGTLMSSVAKFAADLQAMASGEKVESDEPAAEPAPAPMASVSARDNAELATLRAELAAQRAKDRAEIEALTAEKNARDAAEHRGLIVELVQLGGVTPAIAWSDDKATAPSAMMAKLSIGDLRSWVKRLGGGRPRVGAGPQPPNRDSISTDGGVDVSEYEVKRLSIAAEKRGVNADEALGRYRSAKLAQLKAAERKGGDVNRFGRGLEQGHVLANVHGRIGPDEVRTLTNAVRPYETFGTTSQRSLEEFRLDLMVQSSLFVEDWTTTLGLHITGNSLKDTFPLDFSAVEFRERKSQNAAAETPQTRDIQMTRREFRAAKMANLRRIQDGDFAYIRSWQQGPQQMASSKNKLRGSLVVTLLEAGTATYWGQSAEQTTGVEGVYYFATSHKVHPFNPTIKRVGDAATTWSNYQGSATPFSATNVVAEMDSQIFVPHFDGTLLQAETSDLLLPTVLAGPARRAFEVQQFRSDGETSSVQLTNELYQSSLRRMIAGQLTGSDATADYYLLAQNAIAAGFYPWVLAEDSEDEILMWDEASDYYKDTGNIRIEEKTYMNAALAWPHAIRLVKGA